MTTEHFDVHPSVVLKLGDELIADEFTALVEAAKNSYDAGASNIRIRIDTQGTPDAHLGSRYPNAKGTITISDDGEGMSDDDIKSGWLLISYSRKREFKNEQVKSSRRRVPLGDKGIGRLGLQRLGENVDIFTSRGDGPGHHIAFTWKDFANAKSLKEVDVFVAPLRRKLKKGTEILISGLSTPETWRGQNGRDRIQSKLSQLVSPFEELRECAVYLNLDGTPVDLAQFSKKVLAVAELHYSFAFDGDSLRVEGRYSFDYLRLAVESKPNLAANLESDEGRGFLAYLKKTAAAISEDVEIGEGKSRIVVKKTLALGKLGGVALDAERRPASPGPFQGAFFHFDRRERAGGFERASDFRAFLDTQRGVRIYRNGFALRPYGFDGMDWLGLGKAWTEGRGYYGLKPANILGFISVSARDNPQLVEKTDREGLTDTPASSNFFRLMEELTAYANLVNNFIRRGLIDYEKTLHLQDASETNLDDESVDRRLNLARTASKRVRAGTAPGSATAKELDELDKSLALAKALSAEIERLKIESRTMSDLAALGLTAEALSHEIANLADQLSHRTRAVLNVSHAASTNPKLAEFVEYVRDAVAALRKQLAHLAPALRFARERKESLVLDEFVEETAAFFESRLSSKPIKLRVELGGDNFKVRLSKGKLTQVVDNLLLNSEYWVEEEVRRGSPSGWIKIRTKGSHILVSDSGPGVDPSVEARLFQPFVTLKSKGRGLGLYIIRQLLDSMGCAVVLRPDRNNNGARYIFDLDLSGAAEDAES